MSVKVSRVLHAGYVFECEGTRIAFDPIFENPFSVNCHAFPEVEFDLDEIGKLRLDAVFISHFHDDHLSLKSLNLLDRNIPIHLYCVHEEFFSMIRELGFKNVHSLSLNKSVNVGSFEIIPRRALDADVDSIFQIKAAGFQILNVVDSWIDPSTLDLLEREGGWDLVLWPFQTMREIEVLAPVISEPSDGSVPEEWIEQLQVLRPRFLVPSSCQFRLENWSWYNHAFFPISYRGFQEQVSRYIPKTAIQRIDPSVTFELTKDFFVRTENLPWLKIKGEQNVDYEYQANLTPPKTSEIARNFTALTGEQSRRVLRYCQSELIDRYGHLESSDDSYFQNTKQWKLSIYDHRAEEKSFFYLVKDNQLEATSEFESADWTTEVSERKLFAALEEGESLTSMYIRINDGVSDISRLVDVDIMQDPLIRTLFTGAIGTYQAAQLRRLRG